MRKKPSHKKRPPKGRVNKDDKKAVVIFAVAILLLGGLIISYVRATGAAGNISSDFCRKDGLPEIVAVLIDHTDRISAIQKASLEARLWDVANAVEKNGSIRFFSVDNVREKILDPDFNLCNPGSEKEVSELSGNKRQARKHYEEKFANIIKTKLDGILTAETAAESPIMGATQSVVVTSFIGEKNHAPKKKLILVSDLLEHTAEFSLYGGIPDFEEYQKGRHWPAVKADMRDIAVEIFFLNRDSTKQTPRIKVFWQMYFLEQGAQSVKFIPIEG